MIHFRAPLWELVGAHRYAIYFLTSEPEGRSVLPAGRPDRWVYARTWDSAVADAGAITTAQARDWIREAAGAPGLPVRDVTVGVTSYGVGLAERFREGDAFLIGDAAHRVTPRGATGLNTAIRDGFDLGWKLAWVLRGWAGASLLDSYERERRPIAEFNTGRSMRSDGSLLGAASGLNADIGGRIPHVWVARHRSTLDLLGPGLTLFAGPDWAAPRTTGRAARRCASSASTSSRPGRWGSDRPAGCWPARTATRSRSATPASERLIGWRGAPPARARPARPDGAVVPLAGGVVVDQQPGRRHRPGGGAAADRLADARPAAGRPGRAAAAPALAAVRPVGRRAGRPPRPPPAGRRRRPRAGGRAGAPDGHDPSPARSASR